MTNILIIIIGLLVYNYYYFLLYTIFHSSPVEHENLRSKVVVMGKSAKFLKCAKNKISNKIYVVSMFQNHDMLVNVKSLSNK